MTLEFYDGEVGGFAETVDRDGKSTWYQYELVSWGDSQRARIFCMAPVSFADALLGSFEDESKVPDELLRLRRETKDFTAIILSDSYMKNVSASSVLTADLQSKLPKELPNYDSSDFDFWKSVAYHQSGE